MDTSTVSYLRRTALLEPHVLDGLEAFAAQPDRMPDGDVAGLVASAASAARWRSPTTREKVGSTPKPSRRSKHSPVTNLRGCPRPRGSAQSPLFAPGGRQRLVVRLRVRRAGAVELGVENGPDQHDVDTEIRSDHADHGSGECSIDRREPG